MKITSASHLDHGLSPEQVAYITELFKERAGFFIESIELPLELGTVYCGLYGPKMGDAPVASSEVSMEPRAPREYPSRLVERPARPTRELTVIAGPHEGDPCVLYTAYAGPAAPQEPDDPKLADAGRFESIDFWSQHGLARPLKVRTMEEVRARYADASRRHDDVFGFGSEVLGVHLPEGWQDGHQEKHKEHPLTEGFIRRELLRYLSFAFEKASNHRGISAGRSVQKLREWAWLLGIDELVAFADNGQNYAMYGVPVLKRFASFFGVTPPEEIASWEDGEPCQRGCEMGCGQ